MHLAFRKSITTGPVDRMSHRKWRETKQQLFSLPDLALPGCCLVFLHFLVRHPIRSPCTPKKALQNVTLGHSWWDKIFIIFRNSAHTPIPMSFRRLWFSFPSISWAEHWALKKHVVEDSSHFCFHNIISPCNDCNQVYSWSWMWHFEDHPIS